MNGKLAVAIICMASGFLVPLGVLFLILFLWEDGVKAAITPAVQEPTPKVNEYDEQTIRDNQ